MFKKSLTLGLPILAMVTLAGCIDSNYDFEDVDTTTKLSINDLVIPLNLKPVMLDKVIDIDDSDPEATIVKWPSNPAPGEQQYYAVRKGGTFHSDPNTIDRVSTSTPEHIEPSEQTVHGVSFTPAGASKKAPSFAMKYVINEEYTTFKYEADDIDKAIQSLEKVNMQPGHFIYTDVSLTSPAVEQTADRIQFQNLALSLPVGMHATCEIQGVTYTAKEEVVGGKTLNLLHLPDMSESGHSMSIQLVTDYYDLTQNPKYGKNGLIVNNGHIDFEANIGVYSGDLIVHPKSNLSITDFPTSMKFQVGYDMSAFVVDKFSGKIQYSANISDIDPIDLSDLPDFLSGDETNIRIANPEISLDVNNPLAATQLSCKSGLKITPVRDGVAGTECPLPVDFVVGYNKGEGPYEYILAPHPDQAANNLGYTNPEKLTYPTLGDILAGNGLPTSLEIELKSAQTPEPMLYGDAVNFQLGEPIHSIDGHYNFFTPLALASGSKIVYETTTDSFGSEDLDKLTIKTLGVSATASTELPCNVTIKIIPLAKGEKEDEDVIVPLGAGSVTETTIYGAPAKETKIELTFVGDPAKDYIKDLDKLRIIAVADFEGDDTLAPNQNIVLKDIRLKVSGEYIFDLDGDGDDDDDDYYYDDDYYNYGY